MSGLHSRAGTGSAWPQFVKTTFATLTLLSVALSLAACDVSEDSTPEPDPPAEEVGLDPTAILIRSSLDVRGTRPTAEELATIIEDPAQIDALVDAMVDDPRFGARARTIFADALRTRKDTYRYGAVSLYLDPAVDPSLQHALAEEQLALVEFVAVNDLPLTEILTADYTLVEPVLLEVWPLLADEPQPEGLPSGTVLARYTDGRPSAGILSTNSFYWRHTSTVENANRGRTNAITSALLCENYLDRPIDFPTDVDLTDSAAILNAVQTNEACLACHATLDPFASHLWGFMQFTDDATDASTYKPAGELAWDGYTGAVPAYFGVPTLGTVDALAQAIAADGRFVSCTVRRTYESFMGRPTEPADDGQLTAHRDVFIASGLSLKALVRSVLQDPAYRGLTEPSAYGGEAAAVPLKIVSPETLASSLADLTGWEMYLGGRQATSVDFGLRALAGGSDRGAVQTASLGNVLVHRRLAEGGARSLVDGLMPESRVGLILQGVDWSDRPAPEALSALMLEIRSTALAVDDPEIERLLSLWDAVLSESVALESGAGAEAWLAVLTALFADPTLAVY